MDYPEYDRFDRTVEKAEREVKKTTDLIAKIESQPQPQILVPLRLVKYSEKIISDDKGYRARLSEN